jgi:hypothetical protein
MKNLIPAAGLALIGLIGIAQAVPVDVSYTVSGSAGDWTYNFSVTNNLGGTNYVYAVSSADFPNTSYVSGPAGRVVELFQTGFVSEPITPRLAA